MLGQDHAEAIALPRAIMSMSQTVGLAYSAALAWSFLNIHWSFYQLTQYYETRIVSALCPSLIGLRAHEGDSCDYVRLIGHIPESWTVLTYLGRALIPLPSIPWSRGQTCRKRVPTYWPDASWIRARMSRWNGWTSNDVVLYGILETQSYIITWDSYDHQQTA